MHMLMLRYVTATLPRDHVTSRKGQRPLTRCIYLNTLTLSIANSHPTWIALVASQMLRLQAIRAAEEGELRTSSTRVPLAGMAIQQQKTQRLLGRLGRGVLATGDRGEMRESEVQVRQEVGIYQALVLIII